MNKETYEYVLKGKEYQKLYYIKNRDKKIAYARSQDKNKINKRRAEIRRENGIKKRTGGIGVSSSEKALYNKVYHLEVRAKKHLITKVMVLQKVSGLKDPACVRCGIKDIRCLVVNHINGGGNAENRQYKPSQFRANILSGIRKTDDLDVRCQNCNIIYEYERGRCRLPYGWEETIMELTS